jgi:hypothetical protein
MRIELTIEGGLAPFPGLRSPIIMNGDALPPGESARLTQLVANADFFALPETASQPPPGAADYRTYTVTVTVGDRRHTVRRSDPVTERGLRALIEFLLAHRAA